MIIFRLIVNWLHWEYRGSNIHKQELKTFPPYVNSIDFKRFVKNRKRKNLKDLKGKIQFRSDYDYKSMRENS